MTTNIYDMADTWNNGGTTFTAIKMNVTDTASAAASLLIDLQVGSNSLFNIRKDGQVSIGGNSFIISDAANTIAQRNGTNPQQFNIYNTFTSSSNYERLGIIWFGNICFLQTEVGGGGGTIRTLRIKTWDIVADGHLLSSLDNTYDIGANGATRPRTGYFGTSLITPLLSSGTGTAGAILQGTGTNDNAAAGKVGEIIESTVLVGSAVALTTATPANVTSISLTAGDWDVWGNVWYSPAATTSITIHQGAINTTSATLPTAPGAGAFYKVIEAALVPNAIFGESVGQRRISIASTTTVYLVAQATFTVDTLSAYGYIGARRVR